MAEALGETLGFLWTITFGTFVFTCVMLVVAIVVYGTMTAAVMLGQWLLRVAGLA